MQVSPFDIAERFTGTKELPGAQDNPFILGMLRLDQSWPAHDEIAWCSAFVSFVAWLLRLPRSKSLAARSWLSIGTVVALERAIRGYDVVILKRGDGPQPGPEELNAAGHVGFFGGFEPEHARVWVLGGNQGNGVSLAPFKAADVLGIRRLGS